MSKLTAYDWNAAIVGAVKFVAVCAAIALIAALAAAKGE